MALAQKPVDRRFHDFLRIFSLGLQRYDQSFAKHLHSLYNFVAVQILWLL